MVVTAYDNNFIGIGWILELFEIFWNIFWQLASKENPVYEISRSSILVDFFFSLYLINYFSISGLPTPLAPYSFLAYECSSPPIVFLHQGHSPLTQGF